MVQRRIIALAGLALGAAPTVAIAQDVVAPAAIGDAIAIPPAPLPHWSLAAARDLAAAIEDAAAEGLSPRDYHPAALARAMERGPGAALDATAEASALALAHDYRFGRVNEREAFDWYIAADLNAVAALPGALDAAVGTGQVRPFLASLLPTDRRYSALRDALPSAVDPAVRDRLRANMERWRWMPRALGPSYLYVNVPSYRLEVIDGDVVRSNWTVVVGAPDTPTPVLASDMSSLVVNPWWNVPQSIVRKSALRPGRAGFVFKASANGGWQVRQPPGPRNSLGRIKFNLDNDQAIYLHDTPAKALFARDQRALSHGCIRVKNIDRLAAELVSTDGIDSARFDDAYAGRETRTVALARTWPVYLVYFTVDQDADGTMVSYGDPYRRDAPLAARLDGAPASPALPGATMTVASN